MGRAEMTNQTQFDDFLDEMEAEWGEDTRLPNRTPTNFPGECEVCGEYCSTYRYKAFYPVWGVPRQYTKRWLCRLCVIKKCDAL